MAAGVLQLRINSTTIVSPTRCTCRSGSQRKCQVAYRARTTGAAKGYGEVSWKTPIEKNAFEVPVKEKAELLLGVNAEAMKNGANYINSIMFLVNEQKYFASTDGSYIDQDVHRIWPTFFVTKIDAKSGKFETRNALSSPRGMGYEYLQANAAGKINGVTALIQRPVRYDGRCQGRSYPGWGKSNCQISRARQV
jgi:predicted Zn-dependent protease